MVNAQYIPDPQRTAQVYGGILGARIKEGQRPLLAALSIGDGIAYVSTEVGERVAPEKMTVRRVEYAGAEYFPLQDLDQLVGTLQEEARQRREEAERKKKQVTAFSVEQSLIDRLRQRDDKAYRELYSKAYASVLERLSEIIPDEAVQREAAHDFFAILYESRINRARDDDFPKWLLTNVEVYGTTYKPKERRNRPTIGTKSQLRGYLDGTQVLTLLLRYDDKESYETIAKINKKEMIDVALDLAKIRMKLRQKGVLFASEFPL